MYPGLHIQVTFLKLGYSYQFNNFSISTLFNAISVTCVVFPNLKIPKSYYMVPKLYIIYNDIFF